MNTGRSFQDIILKLQQYWAASGCILLQPIDINVGAGTSHPATFLRSIGPEPWNTCFVQPSRRPKDGRYGDNPNRLQHYYQFQVILKPLPENIQDLYLESLKFLGLDLNVHDVRFVEDNWENPTLGAWGVGWEVWLDGMEVTQFTYFQQVGGIACEVVLGEITYGLERLAMYLQNVDNVYDLHFATMPNGQNITYGDVFHQNEVEQSKYNFEYSDTKWLFQQFDNYESQALRVLNLDLAIPGYELILQAAHIFNLLDASGVISVANRALYIAKIRALSKLAATKYYESRQVLGFPLLKSINPPLT